MNVVESPKKLSSELSYLKKQDKKVSFVPTMGALHQGHLSLVKEAKKISDIVVVSIFINPKQFDKKKDLECYPIELDRDILLLKKLGVDYVFIPQSGEIYKEPFFTQIFIGKLTNNLCGSTRPGHFNGVALVLTKFFNLINPDMVVLGLKDYQQYCIIRQLVNDLNFQIKVIGVETIREKSGLAMSSRNLNLSEKQKNIAPFLFKELNNLKEMLHNNIEPFAAIRKSSQCLLEAGFDKIDYLEILSNDLSQYNGSIADSRIFAAVFLGEVRLIDNIALI